MIIAIGTVLEHIARCLSDYTVTVLMHYSWQGLVSNFELPEQQRPQHDDAQLDSMLQPLKVVCDIRRPSVTLMILVADFAKALDCWRKCQVLKIIWWAWGMESLGRRRSAKRYFNQLVPKTVACFSCRNPWRMVHYHYTLSLPTAPNCLTKGHHTKSPRSSSQANKSLFA